MRLPIHPLIWTLSTKTNSLNPSTQSWSMSTSAPLAKSANKSCPRSTPVVINKLLRRGSASISSCTSGTLSKRRSKKCTRQCCNWVKRRSANDYISLWTSCTRSSRNSRGSSSTGAKQCTIRCFRSDRPFACRETSGKCLNRRDLTLMKGHSRSLKGTKLSG